MLEIDLPALWQDPKAMTAEFNLNALEASPKVNVLRLYDDEQDGKPRIVFDS